LAYFFSAGVAKFAVAYHSTKIALCGSYQCKRYIWEKAAGSGLATILIYD